MPTHLFAPELLSWHCFHDMHECLQMLEGMYAYQGCWLSSGGGLEEEVGDVGGEGVLVHIVCMWCVLCKHLFVRWHQQCQNSLH